MPIEQFLDSSPEVPPGAVITPGSRIPPRSLVLGAPGRVKRQLSDEECAALVKSEKTYLELAGSYRRGEAR